MSVTHASVNKLDVWKNVSSFSTSFILNVGQLVGKICGFEPDSLNHSFRHYGCSWIKSAHRNITTYLSTKFCTSVLLFNFQLNLKFCSTYT